MLRTAKRLIWQWDYTVFALRSPYVFTFCEAWQEARASWEMNNDERGSDPMPTPGEAIYHDQFEWRDAA